MRSQLSLDKNFYRVMALGPSKSAPTARTVAPKRNVAKPAAPVKKTPAGAPAPVPGVLPTAPAKSDAVFFYTLPLLLVAAVFIICQVLPSPAEEAAQATAAAPAAKAKSKPAKSAKKKKAPAVEASEPAKPAPEPAPEESLYADDDIAEEEAEETPAEEELLDEEPAADELTDEEAPEEELPEEEPAEEENPEDDGEEPLEEEIVEEF